jgi:hypothetical protein
MSNDQQIAANRLNAQRSTGPRTPAGKARVSSNALKHGLTGRDVVLPGENPDDFDSFRAGLLTSLDPQGELEGALAERIVVDFWRLRRVSIFEATLHRRGCKELLVKQAEESVRQYEFTNSEMASALLDKPSRGSRRRGPNSMILLSTLRACWKCFRSNSQTSRGTKLRFPDRC